MLNRGMVCWEPHQIQQGKMSSLAPGAHRLPALIRIWGEAQLKRMWEVSLKMSQQCVLEARKADNVLAVPAEAQPGS